MSGCGEAHCHGGLLAHPVEQGGGGEVADVVGHLEVPLGCCAPGVEHPVWDPAAENGLKIGTVRSRREISIVYLLLRYSLAARLRILCLKIMRPGRVGTRSGVRLLAFHLGTWGSLPKELYSSEKQKTHWGRHQPIMAEVFPQKIVCT